MLPDWVVFVGLSLFPMACLTAIVFVIGTLRTPLDARQDDDQ